MFWANYNSQMKWMRIYITSQRNATTKDYLLHVAWLAGTTTKQQQQQCIQRRRRVKQCINQQIDIWGGAGFNRFSNVLCGTTRHSLPMRLQFKEKHIRVCLRIRNARRHYEMQYPTRVLNAGVIRRWDGKVRSQDYWHYDFRVKCYFCCFSIERKDDIMIIQNVDP